MEIENHVGKKMLHCIY